MGLSTIEMRGELKVIVEHLFLFVMKIKKQIGDF